MVLNPDFFFLYKNCFRFLLIHKTGYFTNTFGLTKLLSLNLFFSLDGIVDLDDVSSFNYFFLFKFFFGRKAFFSKITSKFHLGVTYFYFSIFSNIFSNYKFFLLSVFVNDLLSFSNKSFLQNSLPSLHSNVFYFKFLDLNIFLEKKTNVGLYNLKNSLNYKFTFVCLDLYSNLFFLDFFKIYY